MVYRLRPAHGLLALAVLLAVPAGAGAETYRWTDERGAVHYAQGLDSVPERYRGGARLLTLPAAAPSPSPSPAGPAAPGSELARIPFTPGRPIMVTARINDGGTVNLLLDTGASVTVINPRVLVALGVSSREAERGTIRGVTGTTEALAVTLNSIEVGQAKVGPLQVVSHDVGFEGGDGLLGRDFLDRFQVNIDNATGVVTLRAR